VKTDWGKKRHVPSLLMNMISSDNIVHLLQSVMPWGGEKKFINQHKGGRKKSFRGGGVPRGIAKMASEEREVNAHCRGSNEDRQMLVAGLVWGAQERLFPKN